jgi:hypothetical protein
MPSLLRSETARLNGAKSRGPTTAAGLEKSSQNAVKHGLTSQSALVLACESRENFDAILNDFMVTYQPENATETDLVEEMVACRWRIRRLWGIETSLLDGEILNRQTHFEGTDRYHLAQAFRYLADDSRSLALAGRYESRLHRIYDHAYATLRDIQRTRVVAIQPEPLSEPLQSASGPEAPAASENESVAKGTQDQMKPSESNVMPSGPSHVLSATPGARPLLTPVWPDVSACRPHGHAQQIDERPDENLTDMQKCA